MIRLTLVGVALAALLGACASDTANTTTAANTASGGGGGSGGLGTTAGLTSRGAPGSQEDLVRYAGDRILFDTDQSLISPEAREVLERQARWLQQNPRLGVWIAGNCDERGTEEYNLALGQRRADADRDYLASRGVDPGRLRTISYGKTRPVDPGSSPEAWAHNRNAITSVQ